MEINVILEHLSVFARISHSTHILARETRAFIAFHDWNIPPLRKQNENRLTWDIHRNMEPIIDFHKFRNSLNSLIIDDNNFLLLTHQNHNGCFLSSTLISCRVLCKLNCSSRWVRTREEEEARADDDVIYEWKWKLLMKEFSRKIRYAIADNFLFRLSLTSRVKKCGTPCSSEAHQPQMQTYFHFIWFSFHHVLMDSKQLNFI